MRTGIYIGVVLRGDGNRAERLSTELRGYILKVRIGWQDWSTANHGLWWISFLGSMLGHGYAKQHAAPAKHMLGAGLARAPS
jgi:hypothetical protein